MKKVITVNQRAFPNKAPHVKPLTRRQNFKKQARAAVCERVLNQYLIAGISALSEFSRRAALLSPSAWWRFVDCLTAAMYTRKELTRTTKWPRDPILVSLQSIQPFWGIVLCLLRFAVSLQFCNVLIFMPSKKNRKMLYFCINLKYQHE